MKIARSRLKELVKQSIYELIDGGPGSGRPRAATPATDKDNKRPTKNPFSKESPAHTPWEKKHGKKSKSSASRKTAKARMKKKIKHAEPKQSKPKSWKKESVKESKGRRCTVKEVQKWMKTLEENRYKKTYNSDARRISWLVNNNLSEDYESMPVSMRKKWSKAAYGRERYLAKEFIKSKEQKLREAIRKVVKMELNEATKDIHHSQAKFFWIHKKDIKKASKLLLKKFPPKGGYHRVEIAGNTGRVPGHFAVTTDKRTYNDALEFLAKNGINPRG